jgi:hypothetical protein
MPVGVRTVVLPIFLIVHPVAPPAEAEQAHQHKEATKTEQEGEEGKHTSPRAKVSTISEGCPPVWECGQFTAFRQGEISHCSMGVSRSIECRTANSQQGKYDYTE